MHRMHHFAALAAPKILARLAWALAVLAGALASLLVAPAGQAQTKGPAALYSLGAGDLVRISVYQNPDLTTETRITEQGLLSYPLLGTVALGGKAVTEAERLIADGLRAGGFVRQPQVTLSVLQVRGHQVSVLGQVNRPGRYPLELAGMRLTDVLALAGGTAGNGADTVVVSGEREGRPWRVEVDLPGLFGPDGRRHDLVVQGGDTLWVDRQPLVYIYGEVQRPGALRLERGMTLMQALASGGGLTPRGTDKGIRVHRRQGDGVVQVVRPALDARVLDGDVVVVPESLF